MNEIDLTTRFSSLLEGRLKDLQLGFSGRGDRVAPAIFTYYLPPKRASSAIDKDFPFILIRPSDVSGDIQDTEGGLDCTLRLVVGAKSDSAQEGAETALLITQNIRQIVFSNPILGPHHFRRWSSLLFDDQRPPFYEVWSDLTWKIPRPNLEAVENLIKNAKL